MGTERDRAPGERADRSTTGASKGLPVLVNRRAGAAAGGELVRRLAERTGDRLDVRELEPERLDETIRDVVDEGADFVAVAGGDGTLRAAADWLAGGGTCLIPLPTGTLNHFARRWGIDSVDAALAVVERVTGGGRGGLDERSVAVGVADDRVFLNTMVLGAYVDVVRRRDRLRRALERLGRLGRWGRWPAAVVAFGWTVWRLPSLRLTLETERGREDRRTAMVWVGLGRGTYPLSHEGGPVTRPELEVAVLRDVGRRGAAAFLMRMLRSVIGPGDAADDPAIDLFHARSLLIRSPHSLHATLDGEPLRLGSPVLAGAVDGALRIAVPASPETSRLPSRG